jgi:uncharacterized protein VirK/YbjX
MSYWLAYPLSLSELHKSITRVHPDPGWLGAWKRIKLVGRGLLFGRWNVRWQEYLHTPFMAPIAKAQPQLFLKVQLPYINRHYRAARRMEILRAHYDFLRDRMPEKLRQRLLLGEPLTLARWAMSTGIYSLRLGITSKYWQEGELQLDLFHEGAQRALVFMHCSVSGRSEIAIGCLQGAKPVEDPTQISNQELISAFKRDMHGLRHKGLLVFALRRLAQAWSLQSVRAVSAQGQLWGVRVQADYNTFWTDEGGVLAPDGMFDLPLAPEAKERVRQRSKYERRDQCLEALGREIGQTLAEPWRALEVLDVSARKKTARIALSA